MELRLKKNRVPFHMHYNARMSFLKRDLDKRLRAASDKEYALHDALIQHGQYYDQTWLNKTKYPGLLYEFDRAMKLDSSLTIEKCILDAISNKKLKSAQVPEIANCKADFDFIKHLQQLQAEQTQEPALPKEDGSNQLFDMNEAASYLGVAKPSLYRYTSQNQIPFFKTGRKIQFKKTNLDEWLKNRRHKSNSEIVSSMKE